MYANPFLSRNSQKSLDDKPLEPKMVFSTIKGAYSLLLNVGVMPVIYSSKTTNMLKDLSLDGLLIEMNDLSKMYEDKHLQDSFSNKLLNEEVQIEAGRQFEKLAEFIS